MCLETKKNGEKPEIWVGFVSRPAGSGLGSNLDPRVGSGSTCNALPWTDKKEQGDRSYQNGANPVCHGFDVCRGFDVSGILRDF